MTLSIIIPVYNESVTILDIIEKVKRVDLKEIKRQIVIVDDGSTDSTKDKLKKLPAENDLRIIYQQTNKGKGAAIKTALTQVTGDIVVIQDADLEYNPAEFPTLIEPILSKTAKVVYGSRILRKNNARGKLFYYLGGKFITFTTNLLYGSHLSDEPTCYKAFDAKLLKSFTIDENGFAWEPEITAKILKAGHKILEIPISYKPRSALEGKKIKFKDGIQAVLTLLKYRFVR